MVLQQSPASGISHTGLVKVTAPQVSYTCNSGNPVTLGSSPRKVTEPNHPLPEYKDIYCHLQHKTQCDHVKTLRQDKRHINVAQSQLYFQCCHITRPEIYPECMYIQMDQGTETYTLHTLYPYLAFWSVGIWLSSQTPQSWMMKASCSFEIQTQ